MDLLIRDGGDASPTSPPAYGPGVVYRTVYRDAVGVVYRLTVYRDAGVFCTKLFTEMLGVVYRTVYRDAGILENGGEFCGLSSVNVSVIDSKIYCHYLPHSHLPLLNHRGINCLSC